MATRLGVRNSRSSSISDLALYQHEAWSLSGGKTINFGYISRTHRSIAIELASTTKHVEPKPHLVKPLMLIMSWDACLSQTTTYSSGVEYISAVWNIHNPKGGSGPICRPIRRRYEVEYIIQDVTRLNHILRRETWSEQSAGTRVAAFKKTPRTAKAL